jgi:hypothetical protein
LGSSIYAGVFVLTLLKLYQWCYNRVETIRSKLDMQYRLMSLI